jgi:hypothetical protein
MTIRAWAICLSLALMPQAPTQESPAGIIVGRVVDVDTGTTLSGVLVTTTAAGNRQAVLTDAQGRFVVSGLAKGRYTLTTTVGGTGFSPSGFLVSGFGHQIGAYLNGGFGQRRPNGPLQPIELGEGERITDEVIRVWKGGAINGRVVDEAGEPLVDFAVAAVARSSDGRLLTGPTARTDDRGIYRLSTLTPGEYLVVVPQTQLLLPSSAIDAALAAPDPAAAGRFSSTGAPAPPHQRVGSPIPDAGIKVGSSFLSSPAQMLVTNSLVVPAGTTKRYAYQTTFYPSAVAAGRATAVAIRSGEEKHEVNVQLQPIPAVEVAGILTDGSGPVSNFGVHLIPEETGDGASVLQVATAVTDGHGAFLMPLVPSGSYRLLAVRTAPPAVPGAAPASDGPLSETAGAWASQQLTVGDENVSNVVLTLGPGIRVSGRVEFDGASERPSAERLKQLFVSLTRAQPLFRTLSGSVTRSVDASLEFVTPGVMPGRYMVNVRDIAPWTLQSITAGGRDVTDTVLGLSDADVKDVVITFTDRPAEIAGTVAGMKERPDLDASVFVFPADKTRWPDARAASRTFRTVRTSRAAAFSVPNLVAGEYFVVAARDDIAGEWPDSRLLAKLAALATTVRVGMNAKQVVNLKLVNAR